MNFPQKDSLQVEDETWTVLAIGPDASKKIDMVTGTPIPARSVGEGILKVSTSQPHKLKMMLKNNSVF